jgi:hypothetical protein
MSADRTALRAEFLAGIAAEIERREADAIAAAGGDPQQRFLAELQQMAQRFAATAHLSPPLRIDDMSPMEMLAARLLPKDVRPAGLPTVAAIWAQYRARTKAAT